MMKNCAPHHQWQTTPEGREHLRRRFLKWHREGKLGDVLALRKIKMDRWRFFMEHVNIKKGETPAHHRRALRRLLKLRSVYPKLTPAIWKLHWKPEVCRGCGTSRAVQRRHSLYIASDIGPFNFDPMRTEIVVWLCERCFGAWGSP